MAKTKLFPPSYHYRARFTADVLGGMRSLVRSLESAYGPLAGKRVVDIGCNDGSLLLMFREAGATVGGVEPTSAALDAQAAGLTVYNDYFSPGVAEQIVADGGHPDFVTFTNVFAHIEDLGHLLRGVQALMGPETRLVVENHYLGSILKGFQFDTFYHEHPRTYSVRSFATIAHRLGRMLESIEFPSRYGGNVRVIIGPGPVHPESSSQLAQAVESEGDFERGFETMRGVIGYWCQGRDSLLASVRNSDGAIYAKAFPGRAAILLKMLCLSEREITAVFEKPGSMKIGHYVPGTRIPIISDECITALLPAPFILLNLAWHIREEISTYLRSVDPRISIIDIFSTCRR